MCMCWAEGQGCKAMSLSLVESNFRAPGCETPVQLVTWEEKLRQVKSALPDEVGRAQQICDEEEAASAERELKARFRAEGGGLSDEALLQKLLPEVPRLSCTSDQGSGSRA